MQLFDPIEIASLSLRNRLMMTVHGPRLSESRYLPYLDARSKDVALVGLHAIFGVYNFPFGPGRFVPGYAADFDAVPPHPLTADGRAFLERAVPSLAAQVDVVHGNGALAVGQILHLGASAHEESFQPVVSASVVQDEFRHHTPHALTVDEIDQFVQAWGEAAARAQRAGVDAIELHAAHGYLINQFLSPDTNLREDGYGGSLDGRTRFLFEIFDAVQAAVGAGFPVGVRLPGKEFFEGGLDVGEVAEMARRLEQRGVAYVNVSGGNYTGLRHTVHVAYVASSYVAPGPNVDAARAIRAAVESTPVIVAGRINDLALAERIIAEGSADMVGLTRALIADPRIASKVRDGRADTVTTCLACNECHYGRTVSCAVNPTAGREEELAIHPAENPRHVLVVGGGPAGMACARSAAERGHRVQLVEGGDQLGGALRIVGTDHNRVEFRLYLESLERQLRSLGVEVELGTVLTAADVVARRADVTVVATGATEWVPDVPGADAANVHASLEVIAGGVELGPTVLVVGGLEDHLPPLTTADYLAERGHRVVLLTELRAPGEGIEPATLFTLTRRLLDRDVELVCMSALQAVDGTTVTIRNTFTGRLRTLDGIDDVVLACGRRPRRELADALDRVGHPYASIGDCLSPRRLVHATLDGARQASTI
jgi:2,4-dienoyl-CoA reductase-like NADH-dependent reductase (Old Yellow Enzyme family)/thioredoxin reductase